MINIDEIKNTIICNDCLEVMKQLPDKCVDLVLTDPPYGIGIVENSNRLKSLGYRQFVNDDKVLDISDCLRVSKQQIVFGGNFFNLPISRGWICWDKQGGKQVDFGDCELIWTSYDKPMRIIRHIWDGFRRDSDYGLDRVHPSQKPTGLLEQIIKENTFVGDTILDPFLGSGTTAVACYRTRRNYIGIEISPEYCKIAEKRIQQEKDKLALFNGLEAS